MTLWGYVFFQHLPYQSISPVSVVQNNLCFGFSLGNLDVFLGQFVKQNGIFGRRLKAVKEMKIKIKNPASNPHRRITQLNLTCDNITHDATRVCFLSK